MKTSIIYKIEVHSSIDFIAIKSSEPHISYYSNLSIAINMLQLALAKNGWAVKNFNYTAAYRALKTKSVYVKTARQQETAFFRLKIEKLSLNPRLNTFDLEVLHPNL